jgi:DNA-binding transcriptional MerR regulator
MEVRRLRERLRIGEVARLVGVTTKTVRHYEKVGLLGEPDRSEAGYRLYTADDLLRLQRVRHLQSLGLSLDRIKRVLGEPGSGTGLREVLEALLAEVEGQMGTLQRRRDRIREVLAREDLEVPEGEPRAMRLAGEYLGEHLKEASPSLIERERKMWATRAGGGLRASLGDSRRPARPVPGTRTGRRSPDGSRRRRDLLGDGRQDGPHPYTPLPGDRTGYFPYRRTGVEDTPRSGPA